MPEVGSSPWRQTFATAVTCAAAALVLAPLVPPVEWLALGPVLALPVGGTAAREASARGWIGERTCWAVTAALVASVVVGVVALVAVVRLAP